MDFINQCLKTGMPIWLFLDILSARRDRWALSGNKYSDRGQRRTYRYFDKKSKVQVIGFSAVRESFDDSLVNDVHSVIL